MNRKVFFDTVRYLPFPGRLQAGQVEGMNAILDEWERRGLTNLDWLADILGTVYWETNKFMQPVMETRQPRETTNPSVDTAIARLESAWSRGKLPWVSRPYWRKDAEGKSWLGRGPVQVTHKPNYERAERELGIPFTQKPELMLELGPSLQVVFEGMTQGWFTGKKLSTYFKEGQNPDFVNARRIINGLDHANEIAEISKQFRAALTLATEKGEPNANPRTESSPGTRRREPDRPLYSPPERGRDGD